MSAPNYYIVYTIFTMRFILLSVLANNNILQIVFDIISIKYNSNFFLLSKSLITAMYMPVVQLSRFGCHSVCCAASATGNRIYQHGNKGIIGPWGDRV